MYVKLFHLDVPALFSFQGAGSALMGRQTRFEGVVRGMVDVLDCPLTVKMRTGIYKKNWNAHKLIPKLRDCGVSLVTVSVSKFLVFPMSLDLLLLLLSLLLLFLFVVFI